MSDIIPNLVCISIDGLHNGMIGAYGNGWIQTPAFDLLAFQSVLFDRYYASSIDLVDSFETLWQQSWLEQFANNNNGSNGNNNGNKSNSNSGNNSTILITDDDEIYLHAYADFKYKYRIDTSADGKVDSADATGYFKIFATIMDVISDQEERCPNNPYCVWAHLRGFRGVWDFPFEYRMRYRGAEDPLPYAGFELPSLRVANDASGIDPDDLQAVMEAYSGGMVLLDEALSGLLEMLESNESQKEYSNKTGKETIFVLFGTRGFALGEHKSIGANYDLFSENVNLPLFVRFPNRQHATIRSNALINTNDIADFLISTTNNRDSIITQLANEKNIQQHEALQIKGQNGEFALVTQDWFIRRANDQISIYVKPDDRWEVNNIVNRINETFELDSILNQYGLLQK
ncbi:MAG: hypothetical protein LBQ66_12585 [Planctomycetaceae bacterium]|jgi:arylsulfatase A-like enzyme|nr:hypothetical protein [Planctomycetaceae bacterium]